MKSLSIILLSIVIAGGGWLGYTKFMVDDSTSQFVFQKLDRGDIIQTVSATGTIEPVVKVIVGSQVSGNIKKWNTDFNAKVKAGDVLAELDPDRYQNALRQAEAELALAKAREEEALVRYKDAQREYKRLQPLQEGNMASDNELLVAKAAEDAAEAVWHGAQASVKSAEASLGAAKVDMDRTIIRSPMNGVVISRDIDVGQTVAASLQAPQLFLIANDLANMQVNANVSESDIGLIKEGGPATFRVDAYPGRQFTGTISQIRYNATIVDNVVTYVTLIEVKNDDLALRPGMTANVTFEVARAQNVLRLPTAALRFNPNPPDSAQASRGRRGPAASPTVYLFEDGKPRRVEVQVGLTDGTYTACAGGKVQEGTQVITERNWSARRDRKPDLTQPLRPPGR